MSEMDRLAADLHAPCVDYYRWRATNDPDGLITQHGSDAHRENADRLIALGWKRLDGDVAAVLGRAADALDAYRAYPNVHIEVSLIVLLRSLAKAYREDTDADD